MTRREQYPLEDECTICEPGTYLLDQSNFSACLTCSMGAVCEGGSHIEAEDGFWMELDNLAKPATASAHSQRKFGLYWRDSRSPISQSAKRRQGDTAERASNATSRRPRSAVLHRCPAGDSE